MSTLYLPDSMGWGNVVIFLTDLAYSNKNPRVYKNLLDVDRGVTFNGITVTEDANEAQYKPRVIINPFTYKNVHSLCRNILKPTLELENLIKKHTHNCNYGIHIRRGAYSKDSENIGCHGFDENKNIKRAYFATDDAVNKFIEIVNNSDERFYLASDSKEIKEMFKDKFQDRIITLDTDIALTYDCVFLNNKDDKTSRLNCYLDWFLLSQCKNLYITGGNKDLSDMSTFGYTAGVYGSSNIQFIFN